MNKEPTSLPKESSNKVCKLLVIMNLDNLYTFFFKKCGTLMRKDNERAYEYDICSATKSVSRIKILKITTISDGGAT